MNGDKRDPPIVDWVVTNPRMMMFVENVGEGGDRPRNSEVLRRWVYKRRCTLGFRVTPTCAVARDHVSLCRCIRISVCVWASTRVSVSFDTRNSRSPSGELLLHIFEFKSSAAVRWRREGPRYSIIITDWTRRRSSLFLSRSPLESNLFFSLSSFV